MGEVIQLPVPSQRERDVEQYNLALVVMGFFSDTKFVPEGLAEFIMDTCRLHLEVGLHKGLAENSKEECQFTEEELAELNKKMQRWVGK